MKFNILTIFPEYFENIFFNGKGVLARAIENKSLKINPINLRDFTYDKHKVTDDYQYGGGQGLVMKPEPIVEAVKSIKKQEKTLTVLLDPRGKQLDQTYARDKVNGFNNEDYDSITFICGRYEGVDERVKSLVVDEMLSIGDYILTGGEPAATVAIEAIGRLKEGVLGNKSSSEEESFGENDLLEFPHYTRPAVYDGLEVPEVLQNGNSRLIDEWRTNKSIEATKKYRPDIFKKYITENKKDKSDIYLGLMHYPMVDKQGDTVATALTNMDIHDISRSCKTFGVNKYFIITPLPAQREIANRVISHWQEGYGASYNLDRKSAFRQTEIVDGVYEAVANIRKETGKDPVLIGTTAHESVDMLEPHEMFELADGRPILLLFGTGWGMTHEFLKNFDGLLGSIKGRGDYNHLSVRSAVAIYLDRIVNDK